MSHEGLSSFCSVVMVMPSGCMLLFPGGKYFSFFLHFSIIIFQLFQNFSICGSQANPPVKSEIHSYKISRSQFLNLGSLHLSDGPQEYVIYTFPILKYSSFISFEGCSLYILIPPPKISMKVYPFSYFQYLGSSPISPKHRAEFGFRHHSFSLVL